MTLIDKIIELIHQPIRFFETYYSNKERCWFRLVIRRGFFGKYVIQVFYSSYRDHDFDKVSRTAIRNKEAFRDAIKEIKRLYGLDDISVNFIYELFEIERDDVEKEGRIYKM